MSISRITYRVSDQHVESFARHLRVHERIVAEAGLATEIAQMAVETETGVEFVEVISWVDAYGEEDVRKCEDVQTHWEVMAACCESRGDLPPVSFDKVLELVTEIDITEGAVQHT